MCNMSEGDVISDKAEAEDSGSDAGRGGVAGKPNYETLMARTSILARLLQSRLALPLLYPLHSGIPEKEDSGSLTKDLRWNEKEITQCISQMTPAIIGIASMMTGLKALHTLSLHQTRLQKRIYTGRRMYVGRRKVIWSTPQEWFVRKPGDEPRTRVFKVRQPYKQPSGGGRR